MNPSYMDAAGNCEVLKDGERVNAAQECQRLSDELYTLRNIKPLPLTGVEAEMSSMMERAKIFAEAQTANQGTAVNAIEQLRIHQVGLARERDSLRETYEKYRELLDDADNAEFALKDCIEILSQRV